MDISKIDIRLASGGVDDKIEWYDSHNETFSLHGVFYNHKDKLYMRVPDEVTQASGNPTLRGLSRMTSGGRLRFVTDSDFVAIKASLPAIIPTPNMSITLSHGFSVYADGFYQNRYSPTYYDFFKVDEFKMDKRMFFAEKKNIGKTSKDRVIDIYFPLYGGVSELYIGIAPGSTFKKAPKYEMEKPLIFYGSSITQGACVSRPGNDYVSIVARRFNADYINLGFSGGGNAEDSMIDYVTSLDGSLYAFDYNMYAERKDRVLPPHFSIYERIREKHPDSVILLYDKPAYDYEPYPEREEIIYSTYEKALSLGDKKVCHIPAKALLGETERDCCMADVSHPNDLGAMRMADSIYAAVSKILLENK